MWNKFDLNENINKILNWISPGQNLQQSSGIDTCCSDGHVNFGQCTISHCIVPSLHEQFLQPNIGFSPCS